MGLSKVCVFGALWTQMVGERVEWNVLDVMFSPWNSSELNFQACTKLHKKFNLTPKSLGQKVCAVSSAQKQEESE